MQFEITNACPLHCPQCYKPSIKNASYMSFDSFIQHINEAEELGVRQITLLGGEPLIHPSIKEMIRTSITKGIITMVVSNGLSDLVYMKALLQLAKGKFTEGFTLIFYGDEQNEN